MINNNTLVSAQHIRPVQMLEPQYAAMQIEPDIEAPQENALPHPNQALQNQQRPALAKQLAEKLQNGAAQVAKGATRVVNIVKDNPKLVAGFVATEALALLATHLAYSAGSSVHLHHVMRQSGAYDSAPDSDGGGGSDAGKIIGLFAGLGILGGLGTALACLRKSS